MRNCHYFQRRNALMEAARVKMRRTFCTFCVLTAKSRSLSVSPRKHNPMQTIPFLRLSPAPPPPLLHGIPSSIISISLVKLNCLQLCLPEFIVACVVQNSCPQYPLGGADWRLSAAWMGQAT